MTSSFYLSDLIGIPVTSAYSKAAREKELQELSDALYSTILGAPPQFPTVSRNPNESYKVKPPKQQSKTKVEDFDKMFKQEVKQKLSPVATFDKGRIANTGEGEIHYISIGIFDLAKNTVSATVTKDNTVEITWSERAGKGEFTSRISSKFIATGAPVLTYEGGVLDISVPVKLRSEDNALFVGKLVD